LDLQQPSSFLVEGAEKIVRRQVAAEGSASTIRGAPCVAGGTGRIFKKSYFDAEYLPMR
jgi:hypothetical protein